MEKGTMSEKPKKINTKSSTEAEAVSTEDVMSQLLWPNYFLKSQGHKSKDAIMHQDNKSSMIVASI